MLKNLGLCAPNGRIEAPISVGGLWTLVHKKRRGQSHSPKSNVKWQKTVKYLIF